MKYYLTLIFLDSFLCLLYLFSIFISDVNKPMWLFCSVLWGISALLNYRLYQRKKEEDRARQNDAFNEMNRIEQ